LFQKLHLSFELSIFAFEPLPDSFEKLLGNVKNIKNIIPLNFALTNYDGEAEFNITSLKDSSSLLKPNITKSSFDRHHILKKSITVKTRTIDSICEEYRITGISILKLDAQGAESGILRGSLNLLTKGHIELIYSECQFIPLYKNATE